MDAGALIRESRLRSGLTQAQLAALAHTSQATLSAYESGAKQPSLDTLSRLLGATGGRLVVVHEAEHVHQPSRAELKHAGHTLVEVLDLADALPVRHAPQLRYPPIAGAR
jgi:transcriptional regulator with XRE-family HTH domain